MFQARDTGNTLAPLGLESKSEATRSRELQRGWFQVENRKVSTLLEFEGD